MAGDTTGKGIDDGRTKDGVKESEGEEALEEELMGIQNPTPQSWRLLAGNVTVDDLAQSFTATQEARSLQKRTAPHTRTAVARTQTGPPKPGEWRLNNHLMEQPSSTSAAALAQLMPDEWWRAKDHKPPKNDLANELRGRLQRGGGMPMVDPDALLIVHRRHCHICQSKGGPISAMGGCYIEPLYEATREGWDLQMFRKPTVERSRVKNTATDERRNAVPKEEEAWVEAYVRGLLSGRVIEEVTTSSGDADDDDGWVSPIFVVRKAVVKGKDEPLSEEESADFGWRGDERRLADACQAVGFQLVATGKRRLVIDLRDANENFVNLPFQFPGLSAVLPALKRGSRVACGDYSAFFHSVPLRPSSRRFVRFRWGGTTYQFTRLCFGFALAPLIACIYSAEAVEAIRATLAAASLRAAVTAHVDDVIIALEAGPKGDEETARKEYVEISSTMGLVVNREKWKDFSTRQVALGIQLDTSATNSDPTAQPSEDKWGRLAREFKLLAALDEARVRIPLRLVEKIAGRVGFYSDVVRGGHARRRGVMICLARTMKGLAKPTTEPMSVRHLRWWEQIADRYVAGTPPTVPQPGSPVQLKAAGVWWAAGYAGEEGAAGALCRTPKGELTSIWGVGFRYRGAIPQNRPPGTKAASSTTREFVGALAAGEAALRLRPDGESGTPTLVCYACDNAALAVWTTKGPQGNSLALKWESLTDRLGERDMTRTGLWTPRRTVAVYDRVAKLGEAGANLAHWDGLGVMMAANPMTVSGVFDLESSQWLTLDARWCRTGESRRIRGYEAAPHHTQLQAPYETGKGGGGNPSAGQGSQDAGKTGGRTPVDQGRVRVSRHVEAFGRGIQHDRHRMGHEHGLAATERVRRVHPVDDRIRARSRLGTPDDHPDMGRGQASEGLHTPQEGWRVGYSRGEMRSTPWPNRGSQSRAITGTGQRGAEGEDAAAARTTPTAWRAGEKERDPERARPQMDETLLRHRRL
jgi:hypothetical protein